MCDNELPSDSDLVGQARLGDPEAFGALYDRYAAGIFRFLYAQTSHRLEAEDLTSDVFLKAWQALPRYRERGFPFSSFLFRIARNAVVDQRRRLGREERNTVEISEQDVVRQSQRSEKGNPAVHLDEKLDQEALHQMLQALPDHYRTVLVLRFINGLSPAETAKVMKRREGATRVLQHRALTMLRKLVDNG